MKPDLAKETAARYTDGGVRLTYEDYLNLPDGLRYELVEGDLRMMTSPKTRHQEISKRLLLLLVEQVERPGKGKVYNAPYDVVLSEHNVVQPDLLVVCQDRLAIISEDNVLGAPDLMVEVLSESTDKWDRVTKRRLYAKYGVREMWIVDPNEQSIEVAVHDGSDLVTAGVYTRGNRVVSPLLPEIRAEVGELLRE